MLLSICLVLLSSMYSIYAPVLTTDIYDRIVEGSIGGKLENPSFINCAACFKVYFDCLLFTIA